MNRAGIAAEPAGDADAFDRLGDRLPARNWGWFALRGVLFIALGIAALLLPVPALFAFALIFAAFSFANGVLSLASGIRGARRKQERWWTLILSGLLGIAVGVVFVFFPLLGTIAYAFVSVIIVAAWAISTGVFEMVAAYRLRRQIRGEWLFMLSAVLSVLLGIFLLFALMWAPAVTLLSVAWAIGLYALFAGVLLLVLAFRLRKHGNTAPAD